MGCIRTVGRSSKATTSCAPRPSPNLCHSQTKAPACAPPTAATPASSRPVPDRRFLKSFNATETCSQARGTPSQALFLALSLLLYPCRVPHRFPLIIQEALFLAGPLDGRSRRRLQAGLQASKQLQTSKPLDLQAVRADKDPSTPLPDTGDSDDDSGCSPSQRPLPRCGAHFFASSRQRVEYGRTRGLIGERPWFGTRLGSDPHPGPVRRGPRFLVK